MAVPANAAVREARRRSTPSELERMNVAKALATAEYSRRQFILNFAASRNTELLIPGRKSEAIKAAEQWAARHLHQLGYQAPTNDLLKFTADERLWATHVGDDIPFPFAFMRPQTSFPDETSSDGETFREGIFENPELKSKENVKVSASAPLRANLRSFQPPFKVERPASINKQRPSDASSTGTDMRRSLSLNSVDELKAAAAAAAAAAPKMASEKSPFFVRLGRSWSRRLSSAT
ncbi:hypothetical protein VTJ04DRAFT_1935 [Mycothermus thermophilus]|uniref:uncharacterized protein n=1 Tax=Humicola insolens TaxID=85995 RepID=UPI0037426D7D